MIAGCELVWRYDRSVLIGVAIQSLGVNWCGNTIARCEWVWQYDRSVFRVDLRPVPKQRLFPFCFVFETSFIIIQTLDGPVLGHRICDDFLLLPLHLLSRIRYTHTLQTRKYDYVSIQ